MLRVILGENNDTVGPDADIAVVKHTVLAAGMRVGGIAEVIAEIRAIAIPITIEADFPKSGFWKADIVVVVTPVGHVGNHNHVVARTAIFPPMEGDDFIVVVEVVDVHVLAAKTTGVVEPIPAQADQIAV